MPVHNVFNILLRKTTSYQSWEYLLDSIDVLFWIEAIREELLLGLGVEFVQSHLMLLLDVLAIIQLLNVDLVIVFVLLPVLDVFPVRAMDTIHHLLLNLKPVLMGWAVHSFDVIWLAELIVLLCPGWVNVNVKSLLLLQLLRIRSLVAIVVVDLSLAHLWVSLAHLLFIISVVHIPLLRVNLRLTRIVLIQTARFLVGLRILLGRLLLNLLLFGHQIHLGQLEQKVEVVPAQFIHLVGGQFALTVEQCLFLLHKAPNLVLVGI